MKDFLKVQNGRIVSAARPVRLRGVNLGGWLMMEGYILQSPNRPVNLFKEDFRRRLGKKALAEFERSFRDHFITQKDFRRIAGMGFNCVRLPFHHALIESKPFSYDKKGVEYLDRAVSWAARNRLKVILDLHAAPGCQNHDWHSDSAGEALLWEKKVFRERTEALWSYLASRYRDEPAVAGYDLLNESVVNDSRKLNALYKRLVRAVRRNDRNHIIFAEGNRWATDLGCLDDFEDENLALSIHFYEPLDFTFNFVPGSAYPLGEGKRRFDRRSVRKMIDPHIRLARRKKRPVLVGEFGINSRNGFYGEERWLNDVLSVFGSAGFHWTYWTYKTIKNSVFPDGIINARANPPWVRREGPDLGWENYARLWKRHRKAIVTSWESRHFSPDPVIAPLLKAHLTRTGK